MLRYIRLALPVLLAALLLLALASVALAAPSNPGGVTTSSCAFSATWFDALSRWLFGLSLVLLFIGVLMGLRNMHTEGPWGAVIAVCGLGIFFGLVALLPTLAPIALAAAGAPGCA